MREKAIRIVLGVAVAVALGFGARSALASPGPTGIGPGCDEQACDYYCITHGANYGFCFNGQCVCRSGP